MHINEIYHNFVEKVLDMVNMENAKAARRRRIAEEISRALKKSGLSNKEFAERMHRVPSEVTKWLSGRHNFTSDTLAEISVVLSSPISGAEDIAVDGKIQLVDGYSTEKEGTTLRDSAVPGDIAMAPATLEILKFKASNAGITLREYISNLLEADARRRNLSASDFCGIWTEDYPSAEELRGSRTKNTFPEL